MVALKLQPGVVVARARYQLIAAHGGAHGLEFWHAHDTHDDRDVALTFANDESLPDGDTALALLERTSELSHLTSSGLAHVLTTVRTGPTSGIVVAEWSRGQSLRELVGAELPPAASARAVQSLSTAAELAHRSGCVLSIDHPDRIRISTAGAAHLAFPGTFAAAEPAADVRGLGAVLYAMLTGAWPLEDQQPRSLSDAPTRDNGEVVDPSDIRADVPVEISAVAMRALDAQHGVRTAATVAHVLAQTAGDLSGLRGPRRLGQRPPQDNNDEASPETKRRAFAWVGRNPRTYTVIGLTLAVIVALLVMAGGLVSFFTGGFGKPGVSSGLDLTLTPRPKAPIHYVRFQPTGVEVYSPQGTPDAPKLAEKATDGDPESRWETDQYQQQLPRLKPGLGLMLSLGGPSNVTDVTIESPSAGTHVTVFAMPRASGVKLDEGKQIGEAELSDGKTKIEVEAPGTRHVLVWIDKLATEKSGKTFRSAIGEVTLRGER